MTIKSGLIPYMGKEWADLLYKEFTQSYMLKLSQRIREDRKTKVVHPDSDEVFKAFKLTPYTNVNAVILGQDPYPSYYAHGLAFSSGIGWECPTSLKYMLKELEKQELGGVDFSLYNNYDLTRWAEQGILLLNSRLTVLDGKPGSHANIGWEIFIKKVLQILNSKNDPIIFLIFGSIAKQISRNLISSKHTVVYADHPASVAYSGLPYWNSNNCFSKLNKFLEKNEKSKIVW